jgi:Flp pilus assembly pilin Flp
MTVSSARQCGFEGRGSSRSLARDRRGANYVEYIILVGAIALIAMGAAYFFGESVRNRIARDAECVTDLDCRRNGEPSRTPTEILGGVDGPGPGQPQPAVGGLPKEAIDLARFSPTIRQALATLRRYKVAIRESSDGNTYYVPETNTVMIDPSQGWDAVVHEAHHAAQHHEHPIDIMTMSRQDYVRARLREEADAEGIVMRGRMEVERSRKQAEPPGGYMGIASIEKDAWDRGVAAARKKNPNASRAELDAAGQRATQEGMLQLEEMGMIQFSSTGVSHRDVYGAFWDKAHEAPPQRQGKPPQGAKPPRP